MIIIKNLFQDRSILRKINPRKYPVKSLFALESTQCMFTSKKSSLVVDDIEYMFMHVYIISFVPDILSLKMALTQQMLEFLGAPQSEDLEHSGEIDCLSMVSEAVVKA